MKKLNSKPTVFIAAFEGWNDGASAASAAIDYLLTTLEFRHVEQLDTEEFIDFQMNRPMLKSNKSGGNSLTWPTLDFFYLEDAALPCNVLILRGSEPSFKWHTFCREALEIAAEYGATTVVVVGALLADIPHTRAVPVTLTSTDPVVRVRYGATEQKYEGPVGIVTALENAAAAQGLAALAIWAAVPHYLAQPPNPLVSKAILEQIESVLGLVIDYRPLETEVSRWQQETELLLAEDEDLRSYVKELEDNVDEQDLSETSGEDIARAFERYLRRRPAEGQE